MSLSKSLLALVVGASLALGVLHLSFSRFASANLTAGCQSDSGLGEIDLTNTVAIWENRPIPSLLADGTYLTDEEVSVLGVTSDEKWIEVDLSEQRIKAWQGNTLFLDSLISSGLTNKTPVGEYRIWYKAKYTKMEGGIKGTRSYYYLPNVPFAMFFYGDYGIHGTYWHNNFGNRMSHGCVNAPTSVAEKLFYWTNPSLPTGSNTVRSSKDNPGTRVVVHD